MADRVAIDGHYLNLPVMNEAGEIVGMVDVLKLTYATLEQVRFSFLFPTFFTTIFDSTYILPMILG